MKFKFSSDLSTQEIYATGPELAETMSHDRNEDGKRVYKYPHSKQEFVTTIDNPVLVKDDYKFFNIPDYIKRQIVQLLLSKPTTIIEYDGLVMQFIQEQYHGVWSPSIDTLLFCRAIKNLEYSDMKTMIEVGSGPGFIAKYIGTKAPNLEKIVMNDINPDAKRYFENTNKDSRARFILGDARSYLKDKKFDLIVCNPPYIPRPGAIEDNPYEGLELLIYLIKNFNKNLIINISSLADDIINPILKACGAKIEVLDTMEVPLKVGNVLSNKERLDYLIIEKGLIEDYHDGHKYRQKLRILKLSK